MCKSCILNCELQKEITQICLQILSSVLQYGQAFQQDGSVLTVDTLISDMMTILPWNKGDMRSIVLEILKEPNEKNQILGFRKILEGAKKAYQEKGVPYFVSN